MLNEKEVALIMKIGGLIGEFVESGEYLAHDIAPFTDAVNTMQTLIMKRAAHAQIIPKDMVNMLIKPR